MLEVIPGAVPGLLAIRDNGFPFPETGEPQADVGEYVGFFLERVTKKVLVEEHVDELLLLFKDLEGQAIGGVVDDLR